MEVSRLFRPIAEEPKVEGARECRDNGGGDFLIPVDGMDLFSKDGEIGCAEEVLQKDEGNDRGQHDAVPVAQLEPDRH